MRKPSKPQVREADIQHYVKAHLELRDWKVIETHDAWHHPRQDGITDLIAVKYGFHAWIECKRPLWHPCPENVTMSKTEQSERVFRQDLRDHGATTLLIKSFDEVEDDIKTLEARAEKYRRFK